MLLGKESFNYDTFENNIQCVVEFSLLYNSVIAKLSSIKNILEREKKSSASVKALSEICKKKLEKINSFSGGTPDLKVGIKKMEDKFNSIYNSLYVFADNLIKDYGNKSKSIYDIIKHEEEKKIKESGQILSFSSDVQAKRFVLHKLVSLSYNDAFVFSIVKRKFTELKLFEKEVKGEKRNYLNKLMVNKKGVIYKSPYSKKNDPAHILNDKVLESLDVIKFVESVLHEAEKDKDNNIRGYLEIKNYYYSLKLLLLEDVPAEKIRSVDIIKEVNIPEYLLTGNVKTAKEIITVFNLCVSELKKCLFVLLRRSFIIRTKFTIVGKNELYYVPKNNFKEKTEWLIPNVHFKGKFASLLGTVSEKLDYDKLKSFIKTIKPETNQLAKEYLVQMPHSWFLDIGLSNNRTKLSAIQFKDTKISQIKEYEIFPARLIGTSEYKSILDRALYSKNTKINVYTMLVEQEYSQSFQLKAGKIKISVEKAGISFRVHIPVTENGTMEQEKPENVIGIDLGEAGIGYAVFSIKDIKQAVATDEKYYKLEPSSWGSKRIRSIRKLMHKIDDYRRTKQRRQKFQVRFSSAQAEFRKNVAGDIAHCIDKLCKKYKAFPIFESSVINLSKGANQLRTVYDKILHMYFFSDIDAHKNERKGHWMQKNPSKAIQIIEGLYQYSDKNGKKEPLKIFYGSAVGAASTSQCCSKCGRNPLLSFEKKYGKDSIEETVDIINSSVKVDDGIILLRKENRESENVKAHKANPFDILLKEKHISPKEGYKILKHQLRRRNEDLRSKDTTQSQYHCPYEDCGKAEWTIHADANAAINIVRKWVAKKLHGKIKPFWKEDVDND